MSTAIIFADNEFPVIQLHTAKQNCCLVINSDELPSFAIYRHQRYQFPDSVYTCEEDDKETPEETETNGREESEKYQ